MKAGVCWPFNVDGCRDAFVTALEPPVSGAFIMGLMWSDGLNAPFWYSLPQFQRLKCGQIPCIDGQLVTYEVGAQTDLICIFSLPIPIQSQVV